MRCIFYIGMGALLAGWLSSAHAEVPPTILLNGLPIKGAVSGVSTAGLDIAYNDKTRTYPWYALAPGTRFRYDQHYRMNLTGFLGGEPLAALLNKPDPRYDPMQPDATPPKNEAPAIQAASGPALTLPLGMPSAPYTPSKEKSFHALAEQGALFWAVKSGPDKKDVVAFCFPENAPTQVVSTLKKEPTGTPPVFVLPLVNYGDVAVEQTLIWTREGEAGKTIVLKAQVDATSGDHKASFALIGSPVDLVPAKGVLLPLPLIDAPVFDFVLRIREGQPVLEGCLRMRQLSLQPGRNLDNHVQIKLSNEQGKTVLDQRIKHKRDEAFTLIVPLQKLPAGSSVTLYARADLGRFLGVVEFRDTFTLPAASTANEPAP